VEDLRPGGPAPVGEALRRAYEIALARCVYLVGDGPATDDLGQEIPAVEVLSAVAELADERRIPVHTFGFAAADRGLLRAIADRTGGRYSDVPD